MDATITGSYSSTKAKSASKTKTKFQSNNIVADQLFAQFIDQINQNRYSAETIAQLLHDKNLVTALDQIDKARNFVADLKHILGNTATKHGEIAEQVEVAVYNAKRALYGQIITADIDSISRTSPIDYYIDGDPVQSKFINGANHNLDHVLDHMHKYPDFINQGGYYHIPKDHYETISKILNSEQVDSLSSSTQEAIKTKATTIESNTGHSFDEIVQPSVSTYSDVQLGNINNTLNHHDYDLYGENQGIKDQIHADHSANFTEGLFATGTSAGVTSSISLFKNIYKNNKAGKSIFKGDYTAEDWQDLGINVGKDALAGGITGAAIYAVTNITGLSAPFAASFVTASKAVSNLCQQYNQGKISKQEFIQLAMISCGESAIVGLATVTGQTLIPIPVVGAVLGAIAGQILINLTKGNRNNLAEHIEQQVNSFTAKLNAQQRIIFQQIDAKFKARNDLINAAFDRSNNTTIAENSVKLARSYEVDEAKIIKNQEQLDLIFQT